MSASLRQQIAVQAAQLVVEEGLEYATARHRAARLVAGRGLRSGDQPRNEEVEDEVRTYLSIFHADTQPIELLAMRELAAGWMQRLQPHRPHVGGAVWRGTATRRSAVLLDLYCDDPKSTEIDLINQGIPYDVGGDAGDVQGPVSVLTLGARSDRLKETVTVHLLLHDLDDLRGALRPDPRGQTWRGDLQALRRRMAEDAP